MFADLRKVNKLRILYIQCFDAPGGQSNRTYLFAEQLDKLGHNVSFFTNRYNHLDDNKKKIVKSNNNNIKHFFTENERFKNSKILSVMINCIGLIKLLKKNEFDVIIGTSVPLINSFFALMAKDKKTQFIYEIRDVWPDALVFSRKISKINPIFFVLKIIEIFIYKKSDGIISALPKTSDYINYYNKNLPQLYLPNSYKSLPKYKKKFNKKVLKIMYIGRFNREHDMDIILRSAKYLLHDKKLNNFLFDIYGYGEKLDYIKNYKYENHLTNLNILGKIEKNSISSVSKTYDLALCTISNTNVFKWGSNLNKIYEYFNSSMPVIFSGKTPLNPVLKAKCGFVCETFNHIDLSNIIIKFSKLDDNEKIKLSTNAKNYFDINYNLDLQSKKLETFLVQLKKIV